MWDGLIPNLQYTHNINLNSYDEFLNVGVMALCNGTDLSDLDTQTFKYVFLRCLAYLKALLMFHDNFLAKNC